VHRGCRASAEIASQGEPGLGPEVAFPGSAASGGESERGAAEPARNVDRVSRPRAVAPQGRASRDTAADDDIAGELARMSEIAADERGAGAIGQTEQAAVEAVDPAAVGPRRYGER